MNRDLRSASTEPRRNRASVSLQAKPGPPRQRFSLDRIMAVAAMAETISSIDPRRKKSQPDPSLRSGLCAGGSVPGAGSSGYTSCETGLNDARDGARLRMESRSSRIGWRGFHHHAPLCIAAYGFLVAERSRFFPQPASANGITRARKVARLTSSMRRPTILRTA